LSHPAPGCNPDDTAPPQRAARGSVCPQCQTWFDDDIPRLLCPDDGAPLIRVADLAAADGDPMLGRVLAGRFAILARLGAGSMGTVYRARQAPIGREVAIKILRSDRAVDEVSRARFLREARANSLLTSPNTVTVFDFGQSENGDFYLAMELLEGESLGQRIKRVGRMGVEEAIETAKQALRSLSEAHAKGIIHRDLKPDNLFFARVHTKEKYDEIVKVLDFGIAKMLHADGELAMNVVETQAGTVFGTPRYMSPEQAQGKPLDARSDLYSLGVILYHMLTGRPPYTDDDAIVVMARHIKTPARPIREVAPDARVPAEVEALVMRVLSKEPEKRPDNAEAMIAELIRVRESAIGTGLASSPVDGMEAVLEGSPRSVSPHAIPAPTDRLESRSQSLPPSGANDTLGGRVGPASSTRWLVPALGVSLLAALVAVAFFAIASWRARTLPAVPALAVRPPPTAPVMSTSAAPAVPAATAAVPATAPSIPTVAASSLPHPEPPHPERSSRPPPRVGSKPTGSSSVGYGYLE
jgi:serine/threonine protein kinase